MAHTENTWKLYCNGRSAVSFPTKEDAEEFKKRHTPEVQKRLTVRREKAADARQS